MGVIRGERLVDTTVHIGHTGLAVIGNYFTAPWPSPVGKCVVILGDHELEADLGVEVQGPVVVGGHLEVHGGRALGECRPAQPVQHVPPGTASLVIGVDDEAVDAGPILLPDQPDGADRLAVPFEQKGVRVETGILGLLPPEPQAHQLSYRLLIGAVGGADGDPGVGGYLGGLAGQLQRMLAVVETPAALPRECFSPERGPRYDQQNRGVLALPAYLEPGIQKSGTDTTAPCGGIDHAGQLDGRRAVLVDTQKPQQPLAVPPQDVLDVPPGAVTQRVPLQLQPTAIGRDDAAFKIGDGAQGSWRQSGGEVDHDIHLITPVNQRDHRPPDFHGVLKFVLTRPPGGP